MKKKYLMVMYLITSMFCAVVAAQTVDEIVNKNIQAMGGLEKLKSLKSLKITGDSMMQGMDIPVEMQIIKPNMIRSAMMSYP